MMMDNGAGRGRSSVMISGVPQQIEYDAGVEGQEDNEDIKDVDEGDLRVGYGAETGHNC